MRVAVIGSGVAGISCAKALVRRGLKVTILDAGETLDAARQATVDRLRQTDRSQWSRDDLAVITSNPTLRASGVPRKLIFGSDFIYANERAAAPVEGSANGLSPTFARGGYGLAWGAAMLPAADV